MDAEKDLEILRALQREGAAYVVFGGVALNLLGLARATRDLERIGHPNDLPSRRIVPCLPGRRRLADFSDAA